MQDQGNVVEYRLDTISRSVRFIASAAPKAATRVSLGVALAVDDAAHDPAGELLGAKIAEGATAIGSTLGTIARAAGNRAVSAASAVKDAVRTGADQLATAESAIGKIPALSAAGGFVNQALVEAKQAWDETGYVPIQVVAEEPPAVESASILEDSEHTPQS